MRVSIKLNSKALYLLTMWGYIIVSGLHVIQNKLAGASTYILAGLIIILLIYTILPKNRISFSRSVYSFRTGILICFILMFFSSLFNLLIGTDGYELGYVIIDCLAIMILYIGPCYVDESIEENFERWIFFLGGIACIIGFYAMVLSNFRISNINERATNTLQLQYYLWKLMECWPFLLINLILRFDKAKRYPIRMVITAVLFLEYVILSLLFMKRMVFFDMLVVVVVSVLSYRANFIKLMRRALLPTLIVFVLFLIGKRVFSFDVNNILQLTLNRFDNDETITEFDRLTEFYDLFDQFGYRFLIAGMGIGSSHSRAGGVNLHMGLLNFIFKGGLPLFFLIVFQLLKAIRVLLSRIDTSEKFYAACVIYTLIRSIISPFWVPNPTRILFSITLAMTLYKYDEIKERIAYDSNHT